MLTSGREGSSGFPNLVQAGSPTFKTTHVSHCHGCCGVLGGTWRLTLSAFDLVAEGGDVLQEASVDWRELAVRDARAAFFSDVLRGDEEAADAFDAYIFQRGHQCS